MCEPPQAGRTSRYEVKVNIYLSMQVLFTISKLFLVVTKEYIINEYSMLYKLFVVWHVISEQHCKLLRKSVRGI